MNTLVDQQFSYVHLAVPLLYLVGSVFSFVGDQYSVLFQLY